MDFGIVFPSYPEAWKDALLAEQHGFSHAWFEDSQMIYGDVYVSMALAAEHTSRIKLGTLVSIPSNRIAPVTAHSIATINQLAPGRVILTLGTGFTGRNTMGLPPVPVKTLREHTQQIRALLRGEEVLFREGSRERAIRFMHPNHGFINLKDPIPLYLAANGPRAMAATAELADGWVTSRRPPADIAAGIETLRGIARANGRDLGDFPAICLTTACVLRPGESVTSERVLDRVGPVATVRLHGMWEQGVTPEQAPEYLRDNYRDYLARITALPTPADRRYLNVHEGHLIFIQPEERRYLNEGLIRNAALTGTAGEVIAQAKAYEAAGLTHIALQVTGDPREFIEEIGRELIARYR